MAGHHDTKMLAWLFTGPLGHLAAGVIDWVALVLAYVARRADLR
jgi:hypothetical protein